MAIKKLVEVWDGKNIIQDNIFFLKKKTHEVRVPLSDNNKQILYYLNHIFKSVIQKKRNELIQVDVDVHHLL